MIFCRYKIVVLTGFIFIGFLNSLYAQKCVDGINIDFSYSTSQKQLALASGKPILSLDLWDNEIDLLKSCPKMVCLNEIFIKGHNDPSVKLNLPVDKFPCLQSFRTEHIKIINLGEVLGDLSQINPLRKLAILFGGLTSIPDNLFALKNLEELNLSWNKLSELPSLIFELNDLKNLNVSNNKIKKLPQDKIKRLVLTNADFSWNNLSDFPATLFEAKYLLTFSASHNHLNLFPLFLQQATNLKTLDLSWNSLDQFPNTLSTLANLQTIKLAGNLLRNLPPCIFSVGNLNVLDVSENKLKTIPEEIGNLKKLSFLDIHDNCLETLPANMISLKNLLFFYTTENNFSSIPSVILYQERFVDSLMALSRKSDSLYRAYQKEHDRIKEKNDSLTWVWMHNMIKDSIPLVLIPYPELPDVLVMVWGFTQDVDCTHKVSFNPKRIDGLLFDAISGRMILTPVAKQNYHRISQSHCTKSLTIKNVKSKFPEINWNEFTNLDTLIIDSGMNISDKNIAIILTKLPHLKYLAIINCKIKSIPTSVFQLSEIKTLDISGNPIKLLPDSICTMKSIEIIITKSSLVEKIPECLQQKHINWIH